MGRYVYRLQPLVFKIMKESQKAKIVLNNRKKDNLLLRHLLVGKISHIMMKMQMYISPLACTSN